MTGFLAVTLLIPTPRFFYFYFIFFGFKDKLVILREDPITLGYIAVITLALIPW